MRDRYRLAPNRRSHGYPVRMLVVDTETYPTDDGSPKGPRSDLHFGYAQLTWKRTGWLEGDPQFFDDADAFWDIVEASVGGRRETLWVVAHNMVGFDFDVLGAEAQLLRRGWKIGHRIYGDPLPFILEFENVADPRRRICIADSLNWVRAPLEMIGKSVGLPKGKDPGAQAPLDERKAYCRRDVEILRTFMQGYIDFGIAEDLGNFAPTLAGQALNAFRHRFMRHEIMVDHRPDVVTLEQRALYGGRTECFEMGDVGAVVGVDRVSMYPSVMRSGEYPVRFLWGADNLPVARLVDWMGRPHVGVIADVTVRVREPVAPLLQDARLYFPVGEFRTVLTSPELRLCEVVRVHRAQFYHTEPIFVDFVDYWSSRRQQYAAEGNDLWALLSKNVQNNLYGKFGQRTPEWEACADVPDDVIGLAAEIGLVVGTLHLEDGTGWRWFDTHFEKRVHDRHSTRWAIPAIAAFVTGYGRAELWQQGLAPARADRVMCDTDSVYRHGTLEDMGDAVVEGKVLGKWNALPGGPMHIHGLKDYVVAGEVKIKGVRVRSEKTCKLAVNSYEQDRFRSHIGAIRDGEPGIQRIRREIKVLERRYNKGHVLRCGRITPYVMTVRGAQNAVTEEIPACPRCGCFEPAEFRGGEYVIDQRCTMEKARSHVATLMDAYS